MNRQTDRPVDLPTTQQLANERRRLRYKSRYNRTLRSTVAILLVGAVILLVTRKRMGKPEDVTALQIEPGKDLCTLVTCTPYGINSHRLLVRGHRVETAQAEEAVRLVSDGIQIEPLLVAPVVALPMLLALLLVLLLSGNKPPHRDDEDSGPQLNRSHETTGHAGGFLYFDIVVSLFTFVEQNACRNSSRMVS